MLDYDISTVSHEPQAIDGLLDFDDPIWGEEDIRPASGIHVSGRLSSSGSGRYFFSGHIEGSVVVSCRRCLGDVVSDISEKLSAVFSQDSENSADDDGYPLSSGARSIDLRPAVREFWVLSVPSFLTCKSDCKGLCPTCGIDRNVMSCACSADSADPRWDVLRALSRKDS